MPSCPFPFPQAEVRPTPSGSRAKSPSGTAPLNISASPPFAKRTTAEADLGLPSLQLGCPDLPCPLHRKISAPQPHLEVLPIERKGAADQGVQNDPQAPDVHLRSVVLLALEELRGGVGGAPAEGVQLGAECEFVAEAKVGYFNIGIRIQQQVFCLRDRKEGGKILLQPPGPINCIRSPMASKVPDGEAAQLAASVVLLALLVNQLAPTLRAGSKSSHFTGGSTEGQGKGFSRATSQNPALGAAPGWLNHSSPRTGIGRGRERWQQCGNSPPSGLCVQYSSGDSSAQPRRSRSEKEGSWLGCKPPPSFPPPAPAQPPSRQSSCTPVWSPRSGHSQ